MHPNIQGTPYYDSAGTNTIKQIAGTGVTVFSIYASQTGGSAGWLQIYNNGTSQTTSGAPDLAFAIPTGTFIGTPSIHQFTFPGGMHLNKGLSYLWADGPTGTVAHGVNATVIITNSPS